MRVLLSGQLMCAMNRNMRMLLASLLSALHVALAVAGLCNVARLVTGMTHCCLDSTISSQVLHTIAIVAFQTGCMLSASEQA